MLGGGGAQAAIGFISNIILARFLLPEDFGVFAIIQANLLLSGAVLNFRLPQLIISASENVLQANYRLYASVAMAQGLINTFIGVVLLWIWDLWHWGAVLLVADSLLTSVLTFQYSVYERKLAYRRLSVVETLSKTASHMLAIGVVVGGIGSIALYIRIFSESFFRTVGLFFLKEWSPMSLVRLPWPAIKKLMRQVKHFWLDFVLEASFERLLILGPGLFLPGQTIGYFVQAKRLAITPHQLLQPLAFRVSFNYFSREENRTKNRRTLWRILLLEIALLSVCVLAIWFFGEEIILFLFGEKWLPVAPALQWMSGVVGFLSLFNTLKSYAMGGGGMKPFIYWGRSVQWIAFLLFMIVALGLSQTADQLNWIAAGYSGAYILAFFAALAAFEYPVIFTRQHK